MDQLKVLEQRLEKNEEEGRELREQIKELKAKLAEVDEAQKAFHFVMGKEIVQQVAKLSEVVKEMKDHFAVIGMELVEIKKFLNNQQQSVEKDVAIKSIVLDTRNQLGEFIAMHRATANRQAIKKFTMDAIKLINDMEKEHKNKDNTVASKLLMLADEIVKGWQLISNEQDVTFGVETAYESFTKDTEIIYLALSKRGMFTPDNVPSMLNNMQTQKYLPVEPQDGLNSSKRSASDAREFHTKSHSTSNHTNHTGSSSERSSHHNHTSNPATRIIAQVPKVVLPNIYYDYEDKDLIGFPASFSSHFPTAQRFPYSNNVYSPCIIVSVIAVNDRIDMNKWIPICKQRMALSENHFLLLVCNEIGDAFGLSTDKLEAKETFKAKFRLNVDNTGKGRPATQVLIPATMEPAITSLKKYFQQLTNSN